MVLAGYMKYNSSHLTYETGREKRVLFHNLYKDRRINTYILGLHRGTHTVYGVDVVGGRVREVFCI